MLKMFQVESFFTGAKISLYVDVAAGEATATFTYQRRIVRPFAPVPFYEVRTPEMAEAWLHADMGERGNRIESFEWSQRMQCRQLAR